MSETSLSPRYKTINPSPRVLQNRYPPLNATFAKLVVMPVTRQGYDNLKSFPTETALSVWHGSAGISRWRRARNLSCSSMTLDFLRQRFALTRISSALPPHPGVSVSAPFAAWTRVRGRDAAEGGWNGWPSFIGNTFLWVKNRDGRWDFRYHARAALIIDKLLR